MIRSALFVTALGFAGCSHPTEQPTDASATSNVKAVVPGQEQPSPAVLPVNATPVAVQQPAPQPPKVPEPPAMFEYPPDLGGKAVVRAVTPDKPILTPAERFGIAPKPRVVPAKVLDPDTSTRANYVPPAIMSAKPGDVRLSAPPERVPVDLGFGADAIPAKPMFPIAAGITERARDVKLPPAMPTLGRPFNERVSLDDPTSEFANAAIVAPSVKPTLTPAPFVRVSLPDPFELGDQVKPKVAPAADPGLTPVVVDPQRVK